MFNRFVVLTCFISATIFSTGCSHTIHINNIDSYRRSSNTSLNEKIRIGFVSANKDVNTERIVKEVSSGLMKYTNKVVFADENPSMPVNSVDVWVRVAVTPFYEGSGWNFLINWPGFLIWTPAWHGYNYNVKYNSEVVITDAKRNQQIDSFSIPFDLDVRHADIGRTWTEIGWLEVGIIPFVGGFVFTSYDDDVSPLAAEEAKSVIADNIVQEIISRINRYRVNK